MVTVEHAFDVSADARTRSSLISRGWFRIVAGLGPILAWQVVFFLVPMGMLAIYSFWRLVNYRMDYTFTLYNYEQIFENPLLFNALVLSLEVAVGVTIACAVLAYPIAYFIARRAGRWRTLLLILVIIPFWTSLILRAYAWKLLLGERGFFNDGIHWHRSPR